MFAAFAKYEKELISTFRVQWNFLYVQIEGVPFQRADLLIALAEQCKKKLLKRLDMAHKWLVIGGVSMNKVHYFSCAYCWATIRIAPKMNVRKWFRKIPLNIAANQSN
ncbi:unnamed protein product [Anisakis simplex]|uniref:Dynein light chain n=1 Tax=Anisakis simplex TaxID=6269 RepID=A0A0M3JMG3_ANISI|nr:unnamed protein product [Anisakis simplex]